MTTLIHMTTREHYEKYAKLAEVLHVTFRNTVKPMGRTIEQLTKLYVKDQYLNNIPLQEFDNYYYALLLYQRGRLPKGYSLAENTCMYKHLLIYEVIGAQPVFTD